MNRTKWLYFALALAMMGGASGVLGHLRTHQSLGRPGVKTTPLDGIRVHVELPEHVLDYSSESREPDKMVVDFLPPDTSFGARRYTAPDSFWVFAQAVLMGTDRTSLHKPQFCLGGQGWRIDSTRSVEEKIRIEKPYPYDLPVMKIIASREIEVGGKRQPLQGIYVYWFVADGRFTAQHTQRMWWMATDLIRTGVLERWAYISCLSACYPGQEDATFDRMKKFIAAAVPLFQLTPAPDGPKGHVVP